MKLPLPARASLTLAVLALQLPARAHAQLAGGQSGYDTTLEAIEPTNEPVSVGLAGADPADIGRYLLAANAAVGGASLSPDGRTVAFSWSITGEPQLWVAPVESGAPRRLTYGNGITFFRWTPDGERILYAADNDGNEQEAYYLIGADGASEALALPATAGGFRVFAGFAGKGMSIVYSSTERNGLDFDVYVADLATGGTRLVREGSYGYFARAPSPDGRLALVAETVGEDSNVLHLLDLASGELRTLSAPERRANHTNGGFAWAADGSGVYLASNAGREYGALVFHRVDGGVDLVREAGGDIENVTLCGHDQRWLAWTVNEDGYDRLFVQDRTRGGMIDVPTLPEGAYGLSCEGEPARMLVRVSGWRTPGSVYVWELASGTVHETFSPGLAGLDPERLVRPESVRIPARDGVELQGLLYLPDATSRRGQGAPPVVFLVHGGPTGQSRPTFDPIVQYHVDRGVAVFEPNVRGSTGFGHTYVTLDDREKRLDSVRDLVDMLEWLGRDGRVDASRAAVVGGSYGGYMVNAVLANFPGHFIAGAALYGVADWVTALEVASPALKASDRIEYGDITEQRWRDFYTVNSPIRQADRIDVPVLYSHGCATPASTSPRPR
jgi:dipeptidyl aminopeptidase/acylaminoacyl peptidase